MTPLTRRCEPDSVEPGPFLPYRATTKHAAISVSSARQHLESPRRIDRPELLGFLVPLSRHRDVWSEAMYCELLQHDGIIGSGKRQRRSRIASLGRALQHQSGRGEIAARDQFIPTLQQRGNLVGIQLVYRIRFWLGFRDRRPYPLKAQRPAIGKAVVGKAQLDSEVHCADEVPRRL